MKNMTLLKLATVILASVRIAVGSVAADGYELKLEGAIKTWDEGIPLGNGMMGGLLWGKGNTVNLSLDRGDLWDERLPETFNEEGWGFANIKQLDGAGSCPGIEICRGGGAAHGRHAD